LALKIGIELSCQKREVHTGPLTTQPSVGDFDASEGVVDVIESVVDGLEGVVDGLGGGSVEELPTGPHTWRAQTNVANKNEKARKI
jgi:hypothetical protein